MADRTNETDRKYNNTLNLMLTPKQRKTYGIWAAKADRVQRTAQGLDATGARDFRKALIAVACDLLDEDERPRTDWTPGDLDPKQFESAMAVCCRLAGDEAAAKRWEEGERRRLMHAVEKHRRSFGREYVARLAADITHAGTVDTASLKDLRHVVMTLEQRRRQSARKAKKAAKSGA